MPAYSEKDVTQFGLRHPQMAYSSLIFARCCCCHFVFKPWVGLYFLPGFRAGGSEKNVVDLISNTI